MPKRVLVGTISQPQEEIGRTRREEIHAIAGHSDDLAVGASKGA